MGQYQMHQHSDYRGFRRRRGKRKGMRKFLKRLQLKISPTWKRKQSIKSKRHRVPYRINPRRNTPGHILIKLTKTKHRERILKAAREKQQVTYKGNPMCLTADLSVETLQARREWQDIFKVLKGKVYNQDYCTQQGSHLKLMEK